MNSRELDRFRLQLDRLAREQIARGLIECNMTAAEKVAYALLWHEDRQDDACYLLKPMADEIGKFMDSFGLSMNDANEAILHWAPTDVSPVRSLLTLASFTEDLSHVPIETGLDLGKTVVNAFSVRMEGGDWFPLSRFLDCMKGRSNARIDSQAR